jgi:diguanylate cyclase (GGDEF)-like protein
MTPDGLSTLDVLLIEDSDEDAVLLKRQLETAGYRVNLERVDTGGALIKALGQKRWDIVFSDFSMPSFDGIQALKIVREHDRDLPFIIVSGTIGEERAAQLMKLGAQDYVIKGNVLRLVPAIERELQEAKLRREHRLAQDHIRHIAYFHPLTQLANRHRLVEDLQELLGLATPVALMIVNLINFHEINGALGYPNGDQLIRDVAGRLQEVELNGGHLYHLHGNEFAVLLRTENRRQVEEIAQDALKALAPHFVCAGLRIHIGARVGIASSRRHDGDPHTLLQHADLASRFAKHEGKTYAWYDAERDPSSPARLALLADLHDALSTDQVFLVFQPKVQCPTGVVTGAEALLRWRHPEHGLIAPDMFVGMAERSGLIDELTHHVLRRVSDQMRSWRRNGLAMPVAINLSAKNLVNRRLMAEILSVQSENENSRIDVEITETALMHDPDQALAALRELRNAGVRIYVDDFGIGFSSLGYLKKLPIHSVKIDKSFVIDLVHSADSDTIVRSTIGLAHNLGLEVIAEGVENHDTWERLASYRCDEGQGNHFAEPLMAEEFARRFGPGASFST